LFSVMSLVLFNSVTFNDCHCHWYLKLTGII
jgi:hypothetical protein